MSMAVSLSVMSAMAQQAGPLKFKTTDVDLHKIPQGVPAAATYKFKNGSKNWTQVRDIVADNGSVKMEYSSEPIGPGKDGYVKITFNASAVGAFKNTVTITTDQPGSTALILHGTVVAKESIAK